MKRIEFHPEVQEDISSAFEWYQNQAIGLGDSFVKELENSLSEIIEQPLAWPSLTKKLKRYILNRFPFSVIYSITSESVYVLAIMHHKRHPKYWISRL